MTLLKDFFADTANRWMVGIFLAAAYLALVNLGAATLWHDEGTMAMTARNLLLTGGFNAWDGRTLYLGNNGLAADSDLRIAAYAPWSALASALGMALFGINDVGVRIIHAFIGLLSLPVFWLLLKLDFNGQRRFRVFAFALFALSTQVLLFMRYGRYVADSFFFSLLLIYAYRLYIGEGGRRWHLAVAAAAAVLGFLNHYLIGAAMGLALGTWHLLYQFQHTTRRQWVDLLSAGAVAGALCFGYLLWAGVIFSGESLEFVFQYKIPLVPRKLILIAQNFREIVWYGALPFWVFVWFLCFTGMLLYAKFKSRKAAKTAKKAHKKKKAQAADDGQDGYVTALMRWVVLWAFFLVFCGLLSTRSPYDHTLADSRYIAPVFAGIALICAAFVEWVAQQNWGRLPAALLLLVTMLSCNILGYPLLFPNYLTNEKFNISLPALVLEVHTPFQNYMTEILHYLVNHAERNDVIRVERWQEYVIMQFYLSDWLVFCCALDEHSTLPKDKVRQYGVPVYETDVRPDWIVSFFSPVRPQTGYVGYELVYSSLVAGYPVHRPELEFRSFTPLFHRRDAGIYIFRKM